jgi:hypothetical protein
MSVLMQMYQKMSSIFWDVIPCSPVEVHRRFGVTSVYLYQTTRSYIQENGTLRSHCREILKSESFANFSIFIFLFLFYHVKY